MAKIQIKSKKHTPFGDFFSIMEQFDAFLAQTIDSTLGLRCTLFGYQYSEILRALMCVYLCGGSCLEDFSTHLIKHFIKTSNPQPIGFSGILLAKRLEVIRWFNQKSMV